MQPRRAAGGGAVRRRCWAWTGPGCWPGRPWSTQAHLAGLQVLAWTVRDDDPGGPEQADAEVRMLLDAGVDGLFSDHPDTTLLVRDAWAEQRTNRTSK